VGIWSKDEGVLDTRVLATHEAQSGQSAGTSTKAQKANPPNLAKPKPNHDQFFLQPNFSHLILHTFVMLPHQDCSKTMTSLFHQCATKAQKVNPPNFAKPKPNQDKFLLQPNFSHLILHTFVTLPHQHCSKTMT